uniref:Uncharacterized protein n=1 Tax=Vitrella brassicaformis TaxID=1169539 RepID=A0A6U4AXP5_9ALVE
MAFKSKSGISTLEIKQFEAKTGLSAWGIPTQDLNAIQPNAEAEIHNADVDVRYITRLSKVRQLNEQTYQLRIVVLVSEDDLKRVDLNTVRNRWKNAMEVFKLPKQVNNSIEYYERPKPKLMSEPEGFMGADWAFFISGLTYAPRAETGGRNQSMEQSMHSLLDKEDTPNCYRVWDSLRE